MKKSKVYLWLLFTAMSLSVQAERVVEISEKRWSQKDSAVMFNLAKDQFVVLISSGLYQDGEEKEGIFYSREFALTPSLDTIFYQRYRLVSPILSSDYVFFLHEESVAQKLVVPKTLLEKVRPVDMNEKLAQLKEANEVLRFMLDTLVYGEDLKRVREIAPEGMSKMEKMKLVLSGKLEPYKKRVWLIDRRYITADSVLLLEVKSTWMDGGFARKKRN
ncbi:MULTISPECIES: hypothetical protein [Butyricimonas]|uniref:hypothetical protein n=1 Tax=Butyricimonas TaxID=574697 RepID=UPI0007FB22CE|nr:MULTISPECIES: hypothetical protein [Butyricimonas]